MAVPDPARVDAGPVHCAREMAHGRTARASRVQIRPSGAATRTSRTVHDLSGPSMHLGSCQRSPCERGRRRAGRSSSSRPISTARSRSSAIGWTFREGRTWRGLRGAPMGTALQRRSGPSAFASRFSGPRTPAPPTLGQAEPTGPLGTERAATSRWAQAGRFRLLRRAQRTGPASGSGVGFSVDARARRGGARVRLRGSPCAGTRWRFPPAIPARGA